MNATKTLNDLATTKAWNQIIWVSRVSLFIVFFWFGLLKLLNWSPAEGLIEHLHSVTIQPLIALKSFIYLLGAAECCIGLAFLIPSLTRFAFALFCMQMLTTFLPLILLPTDSWQNSFALTLVGQYIVKNVALIALAIVIYFDDRNLRTVNNAEKVLEYSAKPAEPKHQIAWNAMMNVKNTSIQ